MCVLGGGWLQRAWLPQNAMVIPNWFQFKLNIQGCGKNKPFIDKKKMIYCLGGLLFFCCLQTARILKLNSCPWELPRLSRPPQESRRAHVQRLDGLKILGSPKHNSDFFFPQISFPSLPFFVSHGATGVTAPHSLMGQTVSRLGLVSLATAMLGFLP